MTFPKMAKSRREHNSSRARTERRKRRRERRLAEIRQQSEERWDGWEEDAESYRREVIDAMGGKVMIMSSPSGEDGDQRGEQGGQEAAQIEPIDLRWRRDKTKPWQTHEVDDLALMLFAMDMAGEFGLSYQLSRECFKRWGRPWHRAKNKAMRDVLVSLGLVERTVRYSVGKHGDRYARPGQQGDRHAITEHKGDDLGDFSWMENIGKPNEESD